MNGLGLHHYLVYDYPDDKPLLQNQPAEIFAEYPYPVNKSVAELPAVDAFEELLILKRDYVAKLDTFSQMYVHNPLKITKKKLADVPRYLLEACSKNCQDPDAYFPNDCSYNWYYTGGILDCISVGGTDFLVWPNRNCDLCIVNTQDFSEQQIIPIDVGDGLAVHNINSCELPASNFLINVRQKHKNTVLNIELKEDKCPVVISNFKVLSEVPLLDAKIHLSKPSLCTVLKSNYYLEMHDLDNSKTVCTYELKKFCNMMDMFGQFKYLNTNSLIIANHNNISVVDDRFQSPIENSLKLRECDSICTFLIKNDNLCYIATKHSFIKYDLRMYNTIYDFSHMLETPPFLINFETISDIDFICLSNQQTKVLFSETDSVHNLPLLLPTINDTYNEMQLKHEFYLVRGLEERLKMATVGTTMSKSEDGYIYLYSLSSAGDLFKQRISLWAHESNALEELSQWIERMPSEQDCLQINAGANLSRAWFLFKKPLKEQPQIIQSLPKKMISYELKNCSDFGKHLSELWTTVEEDVGGDQRRDDLAPEMQTSDKVTAWLETQFSQ